MSQNIESEQEKIERIYKEAKEKVVPFIVSAKVEDNGNNFVGEVIEDTSNGEKYYIKNEEDIQWYSKYYVTILDVDEKEMDPLTNEEIEIYINLSNYSSKTDYFVWVDLYRNETYILKNENNYFKLINRLICSSGKLITPTKRGLYEIQDKGTHFYSRDNTYICYNFLKYSGAYLLHSFPYDFQRKVLDDRLSCRVSNGCLRYDFEDSKYLYDTIPLNTAIWIN